MIIRLNYRTFKSWYFQIFHSLFIFFKDGVWESCLRHCWYWYLMSLLLLTSCVASVPVDVASHKVPVAPVAMLFLLLALLCPSCCHALLLLIAFWAAAVNCSYFFDVHGKPAVVWVSSVAADPTAVDIPSATWCLQRFWRSCCWLLFFAGIPCCS